MVLDCNWMDDPPQRDLYKTAFRFVRNLGTHLSGILGSGGTAIRDDLLKGFDYRRNIMEEYGDSHQTPFRVLEPFMMRSVSRFVVGTFEISRKVTPKGMDVCIGISMKPQLFLVLRKLGMGGYPCRRISEALCHPIREGICYGESRDIQ